MKILLIGFGSIGQRHYKNFIKFSDVKVYEKNHKALKNFFFRDVKSSIEWNPDGVVICTPTNTHLKIAELFLGKTKKILIEKPITNSLLSVNRFDKIRKKSKTKVYVVCNMRFHQALLAIKKKVNSIGRIYFVRSHFGNWLPNMRPKQDYKKAYSASKTKSGGIVLDCIHEIDYLSYLFGKIKEVTLLKKKMSNLPINVEDFATMIIKHKNGVISELHLDYLRPIKMRGCEIVGTDGSIIWESVGKSPEKCLVKYCRRNSKNYKNLFFDDDLDINSCYEKLAKEFIFSFKNNRNDNLLSADDAISQILLIKKCKNLEEKIYENIKK